MKRMLGIVCMLLLLILLKDSPQVKSFRNVVWGMTVSEVSRNESLELIGPGEGNLKILTYNYNSPYAEESQLIYTFPELNGTEILMSGAYWHYIEAMEQRTSVLEVIKNLNTKKYGEPIFYKDGNFIGYRWERGETIINVFNDLGAEAIVEMNVNKHILQEFVDKNAEERVKRRDL